ncbi:F-box/kelch-repeat protein At3g23880-like [Henckelia pumila]|uniref:F-box/kelch-repeat protein At3g23880-like n=1 Tax=Henckelia pumila TaxID=405737 RepID=UPI003C6E59D9
MANHGLPEDVLIEIMVRLPVKSIQRFKCVSKSWRDLLKSSIFIKRHQKRDVRKQHVLLVKRFLRQQDERKNVFSFHDPDFPQVLVSPDLSVPIPDIVPQSNIQRTLFATVHGPCNGLVCVTFDETVFLCNPALREFRSLPPWNIVYPDQRYIITNLDNGFGLDPNTGAYKVVRIWLIHHSRGGYRDRSKYPLNQTLRFDLYNSTSNSWKQIDPELPNVDLVWWFPCFQLFFNNSIHWCASTLENQSGCNILCFDTSTDAFRLMDYPDQGLQDVAGHLRGLMVLNESLAIFFYRSKEPVNIWVMKEYGVKESWTKQFVIGPHDSILNPLLCLGDEWLLYESENGKLAAWALHQNHFKEFQFYEYQNSLRALVYEECLINLEMLIPGDH